MTGVFVGLIIITIAHTILWPHHILLGLLVDIIGVTLTGWSFHRYLNQKD